MYGHLGVWKMSYEGYSQLICSNNHYWRIDCDELDWLDEKDYPKCPVCNKKHVWENMVNITNGSWDDKGNRIDGFIELKVKKKISGVCSCCGKEHVCEITYHIPKENKKWTKTEYQN